MGIRVIITGSTGMVGKGVLLECLTNKVIEKVLVINRNPVGIKHEKLTEIIHSNFYDISSIASQLKGYDACFLCMGVSSFRMNEKTFNSLTYEITTHIAQTILSQNQNMVCTYVSGTGTDSSEQGKIMWARVKGKTENALLAMPFKAAYMFRPGYIHPLKGIRSKTMIYNAMYVVLKPLYPLLNFLFPKYMTTTVEAGKAMIELVVNGFSKTHLENYDIRTLAKQSV